MRRTILWSLLTATGLLLAAALVVMLRAGGAAELPAPDARLPIQLPDGTTLPLADVLARSARKHRPLLPTPPGAPIEPLLPDDSVAGQLYPGMPWGSVFRLAESHRQAGRLEQALALFQSINSGDPDYGLSRRRIALAILAQGHGEPARAVPYAHAAVRSEPFDANSWQDLVRVYSATLGLAFDD